LKEITMGVSSVNHKKTNSTHEPNLLDRIGQGLRDMLVGKKPAVRNKTNSKNLAPADKANPNVKQSKPGSTPQRSTGQTAQPVQVIQKFTSKSFQSEQRMGGLYKSRDNTHQVVQQYDPNYFNKTTGKKGAWQVHIQPVESGRIHPNQHSFTSNRPVTVKDFNDPNSKLVSNSVDAQRLNQDSNRLPETQTAPPVAAKKPDERKLSTADWAKQQAVNLAGGVTSSFTSTVGMVTSVPELAGKFAGSVGDLGKAATNRVTGGQVFKTAMNPIVYERQSAARDSTPLTEQIASNAQRRIDSFLGADSRSPTYGAAAAVAPYVLTRKGRVTTPSTAISSRVAVFKPGSKPLGVNTGKLNSSPVQALKNAVQKYKVGEMNASDLNKAMQRANAEFQVQRGANTTSWSKSQLNEFRSHNVEANHVLAGSRKASLSTAPKPPTTQIPSGGELPKTKATPTPTGAAPGTQTTRQGTNATTATTPPATPALSRDLYVVKTPGGGMRIEHELGQPASQSTIVRAVAEGKLTLKQLRTTNLTEATIKAITAQAQALKQVPQTTRPGSI
jgi:hypothetical protein